jgi:hypothetical protein
MRVVNSFKLKLIALNKRQKAERSGTTEAGSKQFWGLNNIPGYKLD